jgi:hypothetical protein
MVGQAEMFFAAILGSVHAWAARAVNGRVEVLNPLAKANDGIQRWGIGSPFWQGFGVGAETQGRRGAGAQGRREIDS